MNHQKSRLRRDVMNNSKIYQSIVAETDKITPCIGISENPNAIYESCDFHDVAMQAAVANSYNRDCQIIGGGSRITYMIMSQ